MKRDLYHLENTLHFVSGARIIKKKILEITRFDSSPLKFRQ